MVLRKNSERSIKAFNIRKLWFGAYFESVPADLFFRIRVLMDRKILIRKGYLRDFIELLIALTINSSC